MHTLQTLLEAAGYKTRSYSGRSMYGTKCLAITFGRKTHIGEVLADVFDLLAANHAPDSQEFKDVLGAIRTLQADSLGLNTVVYFPDLDFEGTEDSDDED